MKSEPGASGSFILLMQSVSEQPFRTRGISVYFLFLKASAVYSEEHETNIPELCITILHHPKVVFRVCLVPRTG